MDTATVGRHALQRCQQILPGLALVAATALGFSPLALAGACGLEHGYYACHYASDRGQTVNISFPDTHVVTTSTKAATLCSGNLSGVKEASTHMTVQSSGSLPARVVNHEQGCADIYELSFNKQGSWVLDLVFNDGDHGSFPIDVFARAQRPDVDQPIISPTQDLDDTPGAQPAD